MKLTQAEIGAMLADVRTTLRLGHVSQSEYSAKVKKYSVPVILEFPTGELVGNLAGFAWAWKLQGRLEGPLPITGKEQWNAQGLEGKWRVRMLLWDALIVSTQTVPYRFSILKEGRHGLLHNLAPRSRESERGNLTSGV